MNSKIITIIGLILLLSLGGYQVYRHQHPEKFPEPPNKETIINVEGGTTLPTSQSEPSTNVTKGDFSSSINIQVQAPVGGVYKGVVEVGASGFNAFVINMDQSKNWEMVSKEFGESLAYEGFATTEDVKQGLKKYISSISTKGVAGRNTHFVISSGALKNPKMQLIADAISKMGYTVNKVDARQEGIFALKATMPPAYKGNSFVVDIGSGNTKISWYEGMGIKTVECIGAKYYQIPKTDQDAYNEIKAAINQIPSHLRKNCFVIGGVPFQLAKEVKNGDDRFTKLAPPDYYSGGTDVKKKSGINIYRAIVETSGAENCVFDWDANFTIGFLMSLN